MPSVKKIVEDGLCIGCGLCAGLSHDDVVMEMTDVGSLRPNKSPAADSKLGSLIAEVCPGIKVEPSHATGTAKNYDDVWGNFDAAHEAWSGDKTVRYESASGGVLTSLAISLLDSERIAFVLHVGADPERPIENCWVISRNADEVKRHSRSRYGPVAPLAGIDEALSFEQPFAMIGKPCDLNGLENLAYIDSRVDRYCVARLAMVCGGQSKLSKTRGLLREFGVSEEEVYEFRYRGYGNPGLTYAETKTGATFSTTYQELWEEEASWDLETRCKLCPDPLG
ncbi:MAG: coenzyme F420 hydrogenase/dehydrogenase beta subunit N-terminal domain-containing protein [Pseudomonadota bacterium]